MTFRLRMRSRGLIVATGMVVLGAGCGGNSAASGIHKIKHVVVIMQENRSFDNYFGSYPGADGDAGPATRQPDCVPDPGNHTCLRPYPDHADVNGGGPHAAPQAKNDINGGKMDGFVRVAERAQQLCVQFAMPTCTGLPTGGNRTDVMGYHT